MIPLVQLAYVSRSNLSANKAIWQPKLDAIIASARECNAANQVSGYLMFDGLEFAQILEGTEGSVMGTFLRIASDRKHENLVVISRGPIQQRQFASWDMGLAVREGPMEEVFRQSGYIQPGSISSKDFEPILHLAMKLSQAQSTGTSAF